MSMKPLGFPRQRRLLRAKEFASLHKSGRRSFTGHFIVYISPNRFSFSRLGVSINANAGNAVERNRLKRVLREIFRLNHDAISIPVDIHIAVKRGVQATSAASSDVIEAEFREILTQIKNYAPDKTNQRSKDRH
jgi:ribonuclease P protein component